MPKLQNTAKKNHQPRSGLIKTNLFELLQELSRLTEDDQLVIAAVKKVFVSHRDMAGDLLAPVGLVEESHSGGRQRSKCR